MTSDPDHNVKFDLMSEIDSSTASSIYVTWETHAQNKAFIEGYQVHYQKVASSYVQYSLMLPPSQTSYSIRNLVADTYYKVCVVLYRNDTNIEDRSCMDAYTTSWHIPVSIGSSIGAVLALSIIVLIVLLSRCPSLLRKQRQSASESSKYDSMSSHYRHEDDRFEFSDTTMHPEEDPFSEYCEDECLTHDPNSNTTEIHKNSHISEQMCNGSKSHVFGRSGSRNHARSSRHGSRHDNHHHHHHHHHPNPAHHNSQSEPSLPKATILVLKTDESQSTRNHPV
ncbi:hypothetical protein SNE40_022900 [Patella caerulea]|uniref:Fibronectin type-III domain-containing protein n=1 Tax=Patella caerulea TaxID=87958 RepID=A0AAN8GBH4_PATCE